MATDEPGRVLLIRPSALGDVCRSVPVLESLRRAYPDARIDWLVQDTFADAVRQHPALDGVVAFPRGELGRSSKRGDLLPSLRWMTEHLRPSTSNGGKYDLVIDAQGLFRSGLFAWWTGAKRRVGYRNAAEGGGVFYSHRFRIDTSRHAVDRMLGLVAAAGIEPVADMRLYAAPEELVWVSKQNWADDGSSEPARSVVVRGGSSYVVLAPTSRWAAKQWPAERFAELGRRLLGRGVGRVVIVGGPGEREQIRPVLDWAAGEARAIDLVGETSVSRMMAVIARARLVVANDSAAVHMAVGFERPTVALFGPTRVGLVGPYRRDADVIQHARSGDRFEHKNGDVEMITRIGVEEVVAAALARLRATG